MKMVGLHKGFTIVELLIVVVVIAILASITVVAYNGVSAKSRQSRVETNVGVVLKKAELYKTVTGSYPSAAAWSQASFSSTNPTTALPSNIYAIYINFADNVDYNGIVQAGAMDPSAGYVIKPCTNSGYTGMRVYYPNVLNSTVESKTIGQC